MVLAFVSGLLLLLLLLLLLFFFFLGGGGGGGEVVPVYFVFGPFRWFEGEKRMVNLGDPQTKQASNRPPNKAINTQINCDAILLGM